VEEHFRIQAPETAPTAPGTPKLPIVNSQSFQFGSAEMQQVF